MNNCNKIGKAKKRSIKTREACAGYYSLSLKRKQHDSGRWWRGVEAISLNISYLNTLHRSKRPTTKKQQQQCKKKNEKKLGTHGKRRFR